MQIWMNQWVRTAAKVHCLFSTYCYLQIPQVSFNVNSFQSTIMNTKGNNSHFKSHRIMSNTNACR